MLLNICYVALAITSMAFSIFVLIITVNFHTDIMKKIDSLQETKAEQLNNNNEDNKNNTEDDNEDNKNEEEINMPTVFSLVDDLLSGKKSMEDSVE